MKRPVWFRWISSGDSSRDDADKNILESMNLAFLSFLVVAPVAVAISRLLIQAFPVKEILDVATSFRVERIRAETLRIEREGADFVYYLAFLSAVVLVSLRPSAIHTPARQIARWANSSIRNLNLLKSVPVAILLLAHFGSLHRWRTDSFGERFLDGFGIGPTLLAIGLGLAAQRANFHYGWLQTLESKRWVRWASLLMVAVVLLPQTLLSHRLAGTSRDWIIVLNEYASATAGSRPLQEFATTYSSLGPWVVQPVLSRASIDEVLGILMAFHTLLSLLLLAIAAWPATAQRIRSRILAVYQRTATLHSACSCPFGNELLPRKQETAGCPPLLLRNCHGDYPVEQC
jgi:hypothetical protein